MMLVAGMMLATSFVSAQNYTRSGNEFSAVSEKKIPSATKEIKTQYKWKDSKGNTYTIYLSSTGAAYIKRTSSKTGKEYKSYLPKALAEEIVKEMKQTK